MTKKRDTESSGPDEEVLAKLRDARHHDFELLSLASSELADIRVSNKTFKQVEFEYSYIDNVVFTGCKFENCNLSMIDLRNSTFAECVLTGCAIDESLIDKCSFEHTSVNECSFKVTSLTECSFSNSTIWNAFLQLSTFLHNDFERSRWVQIDWSDCTFLYTVLRDSEVERVTVSNTSFRSIFGLSLAHLGQIKVLTENGKTAEEIVTGELATRKDLTPIDSLVLGMNFWDESRLGAISKFLVRMSRERERRRYRQDDWRFFLKILFHLAQSERLPVLAGIQVGDWVMHEVEKIAEDSAAMLSRKLLLTEISGTVMHLLIELFQNFESRCIPISEFSEDERCTATLRFARPPNIELTKFLNEIAEASGLEVAGETRLLSRASGSYLEVIETSITTLFGLQIVLFLLDGVILQISQIISRLSHLRRGAMPVKIETSSPLGRLFLPEHLREPVRKLTSFCNHLPWAHKSDKVGFSGENLKEIVANMEDG
ncbi:MAG TPA: pentapeptide repeat-containing protein [Acidobacteriota bacterium]|nr:pentapeptide repeat-containing protein [Acidobacteriota bacterium]